MDIIKIKLELYKSEREPLRKSFDDEIYNKYKNDETICKPLLEHLSSRLSDLDRKIKGLISDSNNSDEELGKELKETQVYRKKISECVKAAKEEKPKRQFFPFELPELKLVTFDGNIGNWLDFWGIFSCIVDHPGLQDWEKMSYLLQSTTGEAHDFVTCYSINADFKTVIKELKSRFGEEDTLIGHYAGELLDIINKAKTNRYQNNLKKYFLDLRKNYFCLRTLNCTTKDRSIILRVMMEETIPSNLRRDWCFHKVSLKYDYKIKEGDDKIEDPIFEELLNFLEIHIRPWGPL